MTAVTANPVVSRRLIEPIAGTWFNAEEPSLFDLAWKNGEATVTQNGLPFALGRRAGAWFGAERGSFEFMLKPDKDGLNVDLGAGCGAMSLGLVASTALRFVTAATSCRRRAAVPTGTVLFVTRMR